MKFRKFLGIYIRHNDLTPKEKREFASFGEGSIISRPLIPIANKHLITIGSNTTILPGLRLQLYPELVDTLPHVSIGSNCYMGYNISILAGADIRIGDNVLMASNILLSSENHGMDPESDVPYMSQALMSERVEIGDGCWIGERAMIMPGVKIGVKSIIGAGSVVTKNVPDYCVAVGNPAKIIKKYDFNTHRWEKLDDICKTSR